MRVRGREGAASGRDRAARVTLARYIAIAGVGSSLLLAAVLFVSAFVRALYESIDALRTMGREEGLEHLVVVSVRHADALLVATGLLVIGIGLYSIFIERVEHLPQWLAIREFDDLKKKLTSIVVVALAVDFFTVTLEWKESSEILSLGGAIAAVLLGLSAYELVRQTHVRAQAARTAPPRPELASVGSDAVHQSGAAGVRGPPSGQPDRDDPVAVETG